MGQVRKRGGAAGGIDDLMPGLEHPLWEGVDSKFADYVQTEFGIPDTLTNVRITPRGSAGRSAVAIQGAEGAFLFVVTANPATRKTRIAHIVVGALCNDEGIVQRAGQKVDANKDLRAIAGLVLRHLPREVAMDLLLQEHH